jgi:hypothetical protein
MAMTYHACACAFAHRRKSNGWKQYSHNQKLWYDEKKDCYLHQHHNTITVEIYRDKYKVSTGGWNTSTTWRKIHEFARIRMSGRPSPLFVADKFVTWDDTSGRCYTEFYDGIEVSLDGYPLDPQPVQVRRAIPGARAPFYALAKQVRTAVALRMLVGEFDNVQTAPLKDEAAYELLQWVAACSSGLLAEHIPYAVVAPLFAQRELMAFGRPRSTCYNYEEPEPTSAKTRLNSNINAAMRAWESDRSTEELYEIVTRSYT